MFEESTLPILGIHKEEAEKYGTRKNMCTGEETRLKGTCICDMSHLTVAGQWECKTGFLKQEWELASERNMK